MVTIGWILVILALVLLCFLLIYAFTDVGSAIHKLFTRKERALYKFVAESSVRIRKLDELNEKYFFLQPDSYNYKFDITFTKKNRAAFENSNGNAEITQFCSDDVRYKDFEEWVKTVRKVEAAFKRYAMDANSIKGFPNAFALEEHGVSLDDYIKVENMIFEWHRISKSSDFMKVKVHINYVTPTGRRRYYKAYEFDIDEVIVCRKEILDKRQYETTEKYRRKKARAQMTDKLRYSILKRDGFRCQLCGRSAQEDGVKLHADHIRPVAKGGETIESNLRTLCEDCNWGKGDEWDE